MTEGGSLKDGRILIEGYNLTLGAGTGIATYSRVLSDVVRNLDYTPEILVPTTAGINRRDPVLSEIALFDYQRPNDTKSILATEWRRLTASPFSVKPVELPNISTVVGPVADRLSGYSRVLAVPHLLERERFHFKRYGRRLRLKVDQPPRLFHGTRPAPLHVEGCPNIFTVHDIIPIRLPYTTADDKKFYLGMIRDLCRHADHIVTVSEFSRRDIIRLTGISEDRITNTYQAVRIPPIHLARSEAEVATDLEAIFGLGYKDYFMFAGAIEPKKNLSRLIDAYAASGCNSPLIVAGGLGWQYDDIVEKLKSDRFLSYEFDGRTIKPHRRVQWLSYLPFDQLITLMRGSRAVVFPSLYEGFGLPVLEAMALGTPVITSNVSSLPEVAGDAALLVDPYNTHEIAQAIRTLDADDDLRADLSARGRVRAEEFSFERYTSRIQSLYNRILG